MTQTTSTEYIGRHRSGDYSTNGAYQGARQYEAPRPTREEIAARNAYLDSLPPAR